jgi:cobalt-zinc-cadmium efflux system protein
VRETTDILLEATPKEINMQELIADMQAIDGVQEVHDVHVWSITSGMSALSAHVRTADLPLSSCAPILVSLETVLREKHRVGHTTLQFECSSHQGACREMDGLYCQMEENKNIHDHDHEEASAHISRAETR